MPYTPNWNTNNIVWGERVGGVNGWQAGVEVIPYEGGWDDNKNYVYFRTYFRSKTSLSFYSNVSFVETVTNDNDDEILFQYSVSNQGDGRGNNIASSNDSIYVIHSADPVEIPPTFDEAFFTVDVSVTVDDGDYRGTSTSSKTDSCEFLVIRLILTPNNCTYTIVGDGVRQWYDTSYDYIQNTTFTITEIPNQYYNFSDFIVRGSWWGNYPSSWVYVYDNPFICEGLMGFPPDSEGTYPIRIELYTYPNSYAVTANSGAYPYDYNNRWYGRWEKETDFVFSSLREYTGTVDLYNLEDILSRKSELKGWYDDPVLESGHSVSRFMAMPPHDMTVYAHYYPSATLTINYNRRDNATDTQEILWSQQVNVPTIAPTWENHDFIGWTTDSSALNKQYTKQQYATGSYPTLVPNGIIKNAKTEATNTTIYAVWQVNYAPPQISNPSGVRADSSGNPDDDGTWALVEFDAQGYMGTTNYGYPIINATVTIAGSSTTWSVSGGGVGGTWTHSGTHFTVLYQPTLNGQPAMTPDEPYPVIITVGTAWQDYGELDPSPSTTNGDAIIPIAFYTMDFLEGGRSIGIGTSAEQDTDVLGEHPNGLLRIAMDTQLPESIERFDSSLNDYVPWNLPRFDTIFQLDDWWNTSGIGMGQYADWGNLDVLITDYDFLIVCFDLGSTSALTNTKGTLIVIPSLLDLSISESDVTQGKQYDFVWCYPAADPTWFIDIGVGFREVTVNGETIHRFCAIKRTAQNMVYWNCPRIYGVSLSGNGAGVSPSSGNVNITQNAGILTIE